jgi:hypothetical protein
MSFSLALIFGLMLWPQLPMLVPLIAGFAAL